MKDFENARQVLEELEAINNPQNKLGEVKEQNKDGLIFSQSPATARDLQEMNYDDICCLCDLLGMSDIYMGNAISIKKKKATANISKIVAKEVEKAFDQMGGLWGSDNDENSKH